MLTSGALLEAAACLRAQHEVSGRRACGILAVDRAVVRYRSRRPHARAILARLQATASERRRFGHRRAGLLLAREKPG